MNGMDRSSKTRAPGRHAVATQLADSCMHGFSSSDMLVQLPKMCTMKLVDAPFLATEPGSFVGSRQTRSPLRPLAAAQTQLSYMNESFIFTR